jgi:hypothetical protein
MLTVVTPATTTRLTTIAAARDHLMVADDVSDILLGDWIDQASASIVEFCGRPFARESVRETFRGVCGYAIMLSRFPVVGTPAVVMDGTTLAASDLEWDAEAGLLYRMRGLDRFAWGCRVAAVTYTAGWLLPGQEGRDLPANIEQACLTMIAARYGARGRDPMLRSESTEGVGSASWIATADMGALPPQAADLLTRYVRVSGF